MGKEVSKTKVRIQKVGRNKKESNYAYQLIGIPITNQKKTQINKERKVHSKIVKSEVDQEKKKQ
ncbi:hypothetical protein CANARDRAFT_73600 [[Candida] arabinofermentans NRRL YB-2248]|uniref:Uncharacterized protein n=1 Tax=[Candida] arabinofermentans NRRL YB-2248 TaxID=983967 RepID=A0A1E4SWU1_9ASCO|nr:hypothetical protein CANARDRAFT_73600 [[Candida] arabinofermentans NRRL YB-2248]